MRGEGDSEVRFRAAMLRIIRRSAGRPLPPPAVIDMSDTHEVFADLTLTSELIAALRGYLRRYVGNDAIAEDLVQETLLRASRGLDGYRGLASPKTWLFTIASRAAADYFRDPARTVAIAGFDEHDEPSDGAMAVDERMVIDEMSSCVRQVIDSLPASYRSALLLHDFEGLSAIEIAETLDCSVATAKIRIHRARSRLREAMHQSCDFYRDSSDTFRCERKR